MLEDEILVAEHSITGESLVGSYPSAEKQSVYSADPADWATCNLFQKYIPPLEKVTILIGVKVEATCCFVTVVNPLVNRIFKN